MGFPYIYERTITSGSMSGSIERGVSLQNAVMVRQFGTSLWTKIRLAFRYRLMSIDPTVAISITGTPKFIAGFCNGTSSVPGDHTINAAGGVLWNDNVIDPSSTPGYLRLTAGSVSNGVFTASYGQETSQISIIGGVNDTYVAVNNTGSCDASFVDVEMVGASGVKIGFFYRSTPSATTREYYSDEAFFNDIQSSLPVHGGYTYTGSVVPFSMSGTIESYPLNSAFIYWERTDPIVEIIDFYVVRLS